jgi:hypothetical protein
MAKITGIQSLFAAIVLTTGLAACHCSANDNTSRPCVPDDCGNNIGNDEITENRSMGSDCNPRNVMWDGYTSPEERVGMTPCCESGEECKNGKKEEKHEKHGEAESHSGHDKH